MKIFVVGDVHVSTYSSIVRSRGNIFSTRLEHIIDTLNWCEQGAYINGCDLVVYLGDFFDRQDINSEEMTAISAVCWNNLPHIFLCGNHEIGLNDNTFNSCSVFKMRNFQVISTPTTIGDFTFIPYMLEHPELSDIVKEKTKIIFSHNDISGVSYDAKISSTGFSKGSIQNCCDMFVSGHIHNDFVAGNIINVGNICGQNFSEDGFLHGHCAYIIDSDTLSVGKLENPHALYFYKLDVTTMSDKDIESIAKYFKNNAVISIRLFERQSKLVDELLDKVKPVTYKKTVSGEEREQRETVKNDSLTINHIDKLKEFITNMYSDETILNELEEIIDGH